MYFCIAAYIAHGGPPRPVYSVSQESISLNFMFLKTLVMTCILIVLVRGGGGGGDKTVHVESCE